MNKRFWQLGYFKDKFLMEERNWGSVRFLSGLCLAVAFMLLSGVLFEREAAAAMLQRLLLFSSEQAGKLPLYSLIITFIKKSFPFFIPPLVAMVAALLAGARYVQDIYELPHFTYGLRYMLASAFGMSYPHLRIHEGKKVLKEGEVNLIDQVGGPGYVRITPGNVVLFERLSGFSSVAAAGLHFIRRGETIKEIASLEDQEGMADMQAVTKDGIEVVIREVHFRYRLRAGKRSADVARTPENPYPFSTQAVRNMAYNRFVRANGLTPWHDSIQKVVDTVITDYVAQHQLDHLTARAQGDKDPREEIRKIMAHPATRERFKNLGAELLWFDIGHIEIPDRKVAEQRLDTWGAEWIGDAEVRKAAGDAQRIFYQEIGRAEAQANMLMSILSSLKSIENQQGSEENMRNLILSRTAQLLDAMAEQESAEDESETKKLPA